MILPSSRAIPAKFFILIVGLLLTGSVANAAEITFAGTAEGKLDGTSFGNTVNIAGLTYYGATFDDTTVNGNVAFGGNPTTSASTNFNNFGSISVASANIVFSNVAFDLLLNFTAPSNISGGQSQTYTATIIGAANTSGNGGILITFSNAVNTFAFDNGAGGGTFTLTIPDVAVNAGQTAALGGFITENSPASSSFTPEPGTIALLVVGGVLMVPVFATKFRGSLRRLA